MKKDWLGYILLPAAIAGLFVGIRMASTGDPMGWLAIAVGSVLAVLSYRVMTPEHAASTALAKPAGTETVASQTPTHGENGR